jgi:tripartite-type tricarboxylate transporter receptor subunit TctC
MIVPAATSAAVVNRLSEDMRKSLARTETQARLKTLGANTVGDTPDQFREFLRKDHERWSRVIKAAGIKGE